MLVVLNREISSAFNRNSLCESKVMVITEHGLTEVQAQDKFES